jgi:hypothetical protein
MKRRLLLLLIAVALIFSFGATTKPANATVGSITSNCSSITVTGTSGFPLTNVSVFVIDPGTLTVIGGGFASADMVGNYTVNVAIPAQPEGKVLRVDVFDPFLNVGNMITCTNSRAGSAVTFFTPGDGRVDPKPGDRLAVWCSTSADPASLSFYGVASDSKGFFLAAVKFADILKAGNPRLKALNAQLRKLLNARGSSDDTTLGTEINKLLKEIERESQFVSLTRNLGKNGTLIISVDVQNNFWVSWTGGPYNADGQGAWAKSFKCDFKR